MWYNDTGLREFRLHGSLKDGISHSGFISINGTYQLGVLGWHFATYTRDGFYMISNYIGLIQWLPYGDLWASSVNGGISNLGGNRGITTPHWGFATKIYS